MKRLKSMNSPTSSKIAVVVLAGVLCSSPVAMALDEGVRDELIRSKKCSAAKQGVTTCEYSVGRDLHIIIRGVGQQDALVEFRKSSFDGDFYAVYSAFTGCVVIRRGKKGNPLDTGTRGTRMVATVAYISPRSGKVHDSARECEVE